jgi:hypothetical protein
MSDAHNPRPSTVQVLGIVGAALALVAYKVLLPWTPFWVDALVVVVGIVVFILTKRASVPSQSPDATSTNDSARK